MFTTPILFLIFNRPDTTNKVFEVIKSLKPANLFIAADGPRNNKQGEKELCENIRNNILLNIDWNCEVKTLFREKNLGCKLAVSQGINWFFDYVQEGIILEDDCLADNTFFDFAAQMLERFRHDESIIAINGCNFGFEYNTSSYFFSRFINVWGWATWSREAKKIDYDLKSWKNRPKLFFLWSKLRNNILDLDLDWYRYWRHNFDSVASLNLDTWDYQWQYHMLLNNKKTIVSSKNLIKNIGFGNEATHTSMYNHPANNLKAEKLLFPLITPIMKINKEYEELFVKPVWHMFSRKSTVFYLLNTFNTLPFISNFRKRFKI